MSKDIKDMIEFCLTVIVSAILFGYIGYSAGAGEAELRARKAAIATGHAEYRVDAEGRVSFHWREVK